MKTFKKLATFFSISLILIVNAGATDKECDPLKNASADLLYSNYMMGIVKEGNRITAMYKNVNKAFYDSVKSACEKGAALDAIIGDSKQVCYKACDENAAVFSEKNETREKEMSHECSLLCDVNQVAQRHFVDGLKHGNKSSSTKCENENTISDLKRDSKAIMKEQADNAYDSTVKTKKK